jgi:hypothetical protein
MKRTVGAYARPTAALLRCEYYDNSMNIYDGDDDGLMNGARSSREHALAKA